MAFMFENLEVYQKAVDFADLVAGLTESFPRGYSFVADQLNRAALPIATNLAEGNGRSPRRTEGTSLPSPAPRLRNAYRCWRSPGAGAC